MNDGSNRFHVIGSEGKLKLLPTLEDALDAYRKGGYVWFNFESPHHEEVSSLVEPLGLHPLSIEDCFDEDQIPKIENYPTNTFILVNQYKYIIQELEITETDLFLG